MLVHFAHGALGLHAWDAEGARLWIDAHREGYGFPPAAGKASAAAESVPPVLPTGTWAGTLAGSRLGPSITVRAELRSMAPVPTAAATAATEPLPPPPPRVEAYALKIRLHRTAKPSASASAAVDAEPLWDSGDVLLRADSFSAALVLSLSPQAAAAPAASSAAPATAAFSDACASATLVLLPGLVSEALRAGLLRSSADGAAAVSDEVEEALEGLATWADDLTGPAAAAVIAPVRWCEAAAVDYAALAAAAAGAALSDSAPLQGLDDKKTSKPGGSKADTEADLLLPDAELIPAAALGASDAAAAAAASRPKPAAAKSKASPAPPATPGRRRGLLLHRAFDLVDLKLSEDKPQDGSSGSSGASDSSEEDGLPAVYVDPKDAGGTVVCVASAEQRATSSLLTADMTALPFGTIEGFGGSGESRVVIVKLLDPETGAVVSRPVLLKYVARVARVHGVAVGAGTRESFAAALLAHARATLQAVAVHSARGCIQALLSAFVRSTVMAEEAALLTASAPSQPSDAGSASPGAAASSPASAAASALPSLNLGAVGGAARFVSLLKLTAACESTAGIGQAPGAAAAVGAATDPAAADSGAGKSVAELLAADAAAIDDATESVPSGSSGAGTDASADGDAEAVVGSASPGFGTASLPQMRYVLRHLLAREKKAEEAVAVAATAASEPAPPSLSAALVADCIANFASGANPPPHVLQHVRSLAPLPAQGVYTGCATVAGAPASIVVLFDAADCELADGAELSLYTSAKMDSSSCIGTFSGPPVTSSVTPSAGSRSWPTQALRVTGASVWWKLSCGAGTPLDKLLAQRAAYDAWVAQQALEEAAAAAAAAAEALEEAASTSPLPPLIPVKLAGVVTAAAATTAAAAAPAAEAAAAPAADSAAAAATAVAAAAAVAAPPAPPASAEWPCPVCTFINEAGAAACGVCEGPRPAAVAAAPSPAVVVAVPSPAAAAVTAPVAAPAPAPASPAPAAAAPAVLPLLSRASSESSTVGLGYFFGGDDEDFAGDEGSGVPARSVAMRPPPADLGRPSKAPRSRFSFSLAPVSGVWTCEAQVRPTSSCCSCWQCAAHLLPLVRSCLPRHPLPISHLHRSCLQQRPAARPRPRLPGHAGCSTSSSTRRRSRAAGAEAAAVACRWPAAQCTTRQASGRPGLLARAPACASCLYSPLARRRPCTTAS